MAAAPRWKVYDRHGVYQAALKEIEAAACLMVFYGEGATIRHQHDGAVVWREGTEIVPAGESYDMVAQIALSRAEGSREDGP